MVPCHLKPKFALRLACALEDVSLLQVAHDPMVPRSEMSSQRGHFQGKFCRLTSLAIIWPDLWLTGWCWVSKECNTIFPRFPVGSRKSRNLWCRCSMLVDDFLICFCLVWRLENPFSNPPIFFFAKDVLCNCGGQCPKTLAEAKALLIHSPFAASVAQLDLYHSLVCVWPHLREAFHFIFNESSPEWLEIGKLTYYSILIAEAGRVSFLVTFTWNSGKCVVHFFHERS